MHTKHFSFLPAFCLKKEKLSTKKSAKLICATFLFFASPLLPSARVIDKLPAPNRLLLQHLMSVLHQILESADINKMDATNLAVCIAPTLLQLDSTPLDEQHDKLKKVNILYMNTLSHFGTLKFCGSLHRKPQKVSEVRLHIMLQYRPAAVCVAKCCKNVHSVYTDTLLMYPF